MAPHETPLHLTEHHCTSLYLTENYCTSLHITLPHWKSPNLLHPTKQYRTSLHITVPHCNWLKIIVHNCTSLHISLPHSNSLYINVHYCISLIHWCIKSKYNGFAIDCTLKVVPFGFCSVKVMPLFRISFWLLRKSDTNLSFSGLRPFWDLGIFEANMYTS